MQLFNFGQHSSQTVSSWRELIIFSAYRLFLTGVLFFVFYFELPPDFLGKANPVLYGNVSLLYLLSASIFVVTSSKKLGQFNTHTRIQLVLDIVFLTLIIHASGGLSTGLGTLLVVVVVAGGALIPGRLSVFIAAVATLSVLLEVSYSQIVGDGITKYSHAGMLGATFFATALLAQILSHKMKTTLLLAEQRGRDVTKLAVLNQHIISGMQTGIIVVDSIGLISLINQSARNMLDIEVSAQKPSLKHLAPVLALQLKKWQSHVVTEFESIQSRPDLPELLPRFTTLESGEVLIYIDNASSLAQQAQQLKLASLGRLTASIAHEIRNPLGAISHAGELLAEAHEGNNTSKKLTDIIQRHSVRVNGIIETILDMSRRKTVEQTVILLALWLEQLINDFCEINHINKEEIKLKIDAPLARVYMDEEQLHQVFCNLLENAWHFSNPGLEKTRVTLTLSSHNNNVIIDINDNGVGISEEVSKHLFEPFHSERQGGTGLGLYLAREMCQANGAQLMNLENKGGACFRVSFPIERQEILH